MSEGQGKLACVTGASGFIGSHVVRELLERGHRVRASVRDPSDEGTSKHLRELPGAAERLDLFGGDLLKLGSFDEAIAGCEWVFHLASPVFLAARDPQGEIIDPTIQGTNNVLDAVEKTETVKRVGLTSSILAVVDASERRTHTYTEDDWCQDATVETAPYPLAKVTAEKAVWERKQKLGFDVTVVNPTLVLGPVLAEMHLRSSPSAIRSIVRGEYPGCPKLAWGIVDVRDVAAALLTGIETGANGRFILNKQSMWMREMAQMLKPYYPKLTIRTWQLPNFFLYLAPLFDKRVSFGYLKRNLGRMDRVDNSKVRRELGLSLRPIDQTLRDTVDSMIERGFLESK